MITNPDLASRRWLILASAMVSFFAVGTTFFAVPPLVGILRSEIGLSNLQVGLLMGAIAFPAIFLSIPLGAAVDRLSPRGAGLVGLGLMMVGALMFAAGRVFWALAAGRLLFGIGALGINLLMARLISEAFAGRELALAMGLFTGTYPISMIVLFSAHPRLVAAMGWQHEMGLLAVLVALAIPIHAVAVPARRPVAPAPTSGGVWLPPGPLVALGLAWMLYFCAFAAVPTFAPDWTGGGAAGLLVTSVITWVALFATPLAGGLIDRIGRPERWCAAGLTLLVVTLVAMATGLAAPIVAMALIGVVAGIVPPAVYALPGRLVAAERVGLAFGFITALSNLGTVIGPAVAGTIRDATPSWPVLWGVLAVIGVGSVAAALAVRPAAPSAS